MVNEDKKLSNELKSNDVAENVEMREELQKPLTQSEVVQTMEGENNSQKEAVDGSKPMIDDNVVQFASPSAVQAVNDLIDEQEPDRKTSKWVLIIVVLVLLILALVAGVVYYFTQFNEEPTPLVSPLPEQVETMPSPTPEPDSMLQDLQQVNESDDVEAIKNDVDNTNIDTLGNDLEEIEGSL